MLLFIILFINLFSLSIANPYYDYALPQAIKPLEYDIYLIPYLDTPTDRAFTFDGNVSVRLDVKQSTRVIRLHAYNMSVNGATVSSLDTGTNIRVVNTVLANDDKQFLTLDLEESLLTGNNYTLSMSFKGILNEGLDGFYRSSYNDSEYGRTWLAATQFSPTGARRAFPCWDEPSWKAKFTLHIAHPPGYNVLSNMPMDSSSRLYEPEGWTWVHLRQTPVMSTFIVGFTVSPFASLLSTVDYRFKVWSRRDVVLQGSYANSLAPRVLSYMENYTSIMYEMPKMDQAAIPDFAATAMENWGMINYREPALLFAENISSTEDRQKVATVISHEVAHQWFGNLVSPAWWGYVWLKEGFARYFQYFALAPLEPEWQLPEQFVQDEMRFVFQLDSLNTSHALNAEVGSPSSIAANFDNFAYNKGACIIRQIVHMMRENNFKSGMNNYLTTLAYDNAFPKDLWSALSPYVPENVLPPGHNLSSIMHTWTDQAGYPVIYVIRNYNNDTKSVVIKQTRFLTAGSYHNETYVIPLTYTTAVNPQFNNTEVTAWHLGPELSLDINLTVNSEQWIIFNIQQTGYYRVNYDQRNWQLLAAAQLQLHPINRAQVMDDALALARISYVDYPTALDTTAYLNQEKDYTPWNSATASLRYIYDRLAYIDEWRVLFEWYGLDKLNPMYVHLGGIISPADEGHVDRLLRTLILSSSCMLMHEDCNKDSVTLFSEWQAKEDPDADNPIVPDLKSVVYCAGMRAGGQREYDFLFERYDKALYYSTEQSHILNALGCASDTQLLEKYLNESIAENSKVRRHDARNVITAVYNNYLGVNVSLDFLLSNYERCAEVYGGFGSMGKVFSGLSSKLNTQHHRDQLQTFLDTSTLPESDVKAVRSALLTVDEILAWHTAHRDTVLKYFSDLHSAASTATVLTLSVGALLLIIISAFSFRNYGSGAMLILSK